MLWCTKRSLKEWLRCVATLILFRSLKLFELLGRAARGITAAGEPLVDEVPVWLQHSLVRVVGMPHSEVVRLTQDQAQAVWDEFICAPKTQREFPE